MAEKKQVPTEKNPVGAAVLSAIFPGVGFFYIGNVVKGIAYVLVFISLLVLLIHSRGSDPVVFSLLLAAFYIFQVFDSYNEARKAEPTPTTGEKPVKPQESMNLFTSITVLILGIVFQMAQLDIIRIRDVARLWPLILIALGARYIYLYSLGNKNKKNEFQPDKDENGGKYE